MRQSELWIKSYRDRKSPMNSGELLWPLYRGRSGYFAVWSGSGQTFSEGVRVRAPILVYNFVLEIPTSTLLDLLPRTLPHVLVSDQDRQVNLDGIVRTTPICFLGFRSNSPWVFRDPSNAKISRRTVYTAPYAFSLSFFRSHLYLRCGRIFNLVPWGSRYIRHLSSAIEPRVLTPRRHYPRLGVAEPPSPFSLIHHPMPRHDARRLGVDEAARKMTLHQGLSA
ncbi:hypothetical protein PIB30_088699 [Stylosanthes scabra]|uniref:Uncharacterized protein n=1 Tax=Stylosanthes scabra TaxID=79078 RepID=A0ABU6SUE0_9FABA|nr:hypothetical protein [Stylosanthes scabra]